MQKSYFIGTETHRRPRRDKKMKRWNRWNNKINHKRWPKSVISWLAALLYCREHGGIVTLLMLSLFVGVDCAKLATGRTDAAYYALCYYCHMTYYLELISNKGAHTQFTSSCASPNLVPTWAWGYLLNRPNQPHFVVGTGHMWLWLGVPSRLTINSQRKPKNYSIRRKWQKCSFDFQKVSVSIYVYVCIN